MTSQKIATKNETTSKSDHPISRVSWDFIMKFYPNYAHSNEISRSDDLEKILVGEDEEESSAREILINEFNGDRNHEQLILEYESIHHSICAQAINNLAEMENFANEWMEIQ